MSQAIWIKAVSNLAEKFKNLSKEGKWPFPRPFKDFTHSQYKFLTDLGGENNQPIGLQGSYAGGKSFILVSKALISASIPNNRVAIFRKFQKDLIETTFEGTFLPIVEATGQAKELLLDKKNSPRTIMKNGSIIYWKGLFTTGKKEPTRLGSTQYGGIMIDEAQEIDDAKVILALIGRNRWPAAEGFYHLSMSYNPPTTTAWLQEWRDKHRLIVYECPIEENLPNLPDGYVDSMEKNYPEAWKRKYLRGQTGQLPQGKPAYEFYDNHFRELTYNPNLPLVRAFDFGVNYGVCVIGQMDASPRICILDVVVKQDSWTRPLARAVKECCVSKYPESFRSDRRNLDFMDGYDKGKNSRSELSNEDILIQEGFSPIPVHTHYDIRIKRINEALERYSKGEPYIVVDNRLPELFESLKDGYCVDAKGKIIKDGYYEHFGDAFSILVMGLLAQTFTSGVLSIKYSSFDDDLDYIGTLRNPTKSLIKEAWGQEENVQLLIRDTLEGER